MVKAFLNKGVTLNALNKRGESPLYYAVIKSWSRRPAEQRQVVQLLLKKGAIFKGKLSNYKQRMLRRDYPRLFRKILSTSEASSAPGAKAPAKPPAFLDLKKKRSPGGDAKTSKELDRDENDRDDDDNDDDDDDGKEEPKPSAKKKKKKKRGQNFLDE